MKRGTVGKREIGVQRQSLESEEDEEQQSGETAEAKNRIRNTESRSYAHNVRQSKSSQK